MHRFLQRHAQKVIGVLSGFDRLVFRGTLRHLAYVTGFQKFLSKQGVLLKDFKPYAESMTNQLKEASCRLAEESGRPVRYLPSSRTSKEEVARQIAAEDGIEEGLIGVLTCVEPCMSYEISRNKAAKKLVLRAKERKCLHLYHYAIDPVFGFVGARIQTWFPFSIQITVNGREWLARDLDRAGMDYHREGNCFPWLEDVEKAQQIMGQQVRTNFRQQLDRLGGMLNPDHEQMFRGTDFPRYWSVYQSEWATDVMFDSPQSLAEIYPALVKYAMTSIGSGDVMRFLGRKTGTRFEGEIVTDFRNRQEGVRVKHQVEENSAKMYDKAWTIVRTETTMNNGARFKVYRPKEGDPGGELAWRPMRKGIADIWPRTEVSQKINERYLDTLAAADTSESVGKLLAEVSRRVKWKGRPVRALRPSDALDLKLFRLLASGEFAMAGIRNQDIQQALNEQATRDQSEKRRRSARATRLIRILRAHGLVKKVPRTHRYQVTDKGRRISAAVVASQAATVEQLVAA